MGFDTGPGNVLMDAWIHTQQKQNYDENGAWGAQGKIEDHFLESLLQDPYFELSPPKSTGRDHFNLFWLQDYLNSMRKVIAPVDVQRTLVELTARTIMQGIHDLMSSGEVIICGGGVRNRFLMTRLAKLATPHFTVASTEEHGMDPDWVEAIAFAWLARQTLKHAPGNIPSVTGAKQAAILGGIYNN
jgi:anhydro-N-acetylmuramic acid kinase